MFYNNENCLKKIALCRNMNVCFNACHAELTEKDQNIMKEVIMSYWCWAILPVGSEAPVCPGEPSSSV